LERFKNSGDAPAQSSAPKSTPTPPASKPAPPVKEQDYQGLPF